MKEFMKLYESVLILDKPYSVKMEYVTDHWSDKYNAVVKRVNLIKLLQSDGKALVSVDFRLYNLDGIIKNDRFKTILKTANSRVFKPSYVLFDIWYSYINNIKIIKEIWLELFIKLKSNRLVSSGENGDMPISNLGGSAS